VKLVLASLCTASFARRYSGDPDAKNIFLVNYGRREHSCPQTAHFLDFPTADVVFPDGGPVCTTGDYGGRDQVLLAALDKATATRVLDLIHAPPPEGKYKALKDRLLDTFGLSKRERASRLLHSRPLSDSKPSILMDELMALLGDHPPCMLFEQLFLERLLHDIKVQLTDAKFEDHRELAKKADALWAAKDMGAGALPSSNANHPNPSLPTTCSATGSERPLGMQGPLHLVGKQAGQSPLVASAAGLNDSLLFVSDTHSGHRFLVDTCQPLVWTLAWGSQVPHSRQPTAGATPSSVPATLQQAKIVYVRCDAHCTPLQRPYEGPFRVIESGHKTFKIDMGGKSETITVDRLKLAHLDVDCPVQLAQPRPRGQPPGKAQRPSTSHVPQRARAKRQSRLKLSTAPPPPIPRSPQRTRAGRQVCLNRKYISVRGGGGGGGLCSGQITSLYQTSCCTCLPTFTNNI
jgi:hypothetical protein